jgi:hyaluronan synthase
MPKVVIGIPCFNEDQYITDTLLSAIQQLDEYTDLEIWISDNKSTDNSVSKVEAVLEAVKSAVNHVTLVEQEGMSGLDNFGIFSMLPIRSFLCG